MTYWTRLACACAVLAIAGTAHAQNYPRSRRQDDRTFPGRRAQRHCRAHHGRRHEQAILASNIVIENVGGAGGTIGATRAAEADAGRLHDLAASMGTVIAAPSFYPNLKYDSTKDFEPIGMTANAPAAAMALKDSPGQKRQGIRRVR